MKKFSLHEHCRGSPARQRFSFPPCRCRLKRTPDTHFPRHDAQIVVIIHNNPFLERPTRNRTPIAHQIPRCPKVTQQVQVRRRHETHGVNRAKHGSGVGGGQAIRQAYAPPRTTAVVLACWPKLTEIDPKIAEIGRNRPKLSEIS